MKPDFNIYLPILLRHEGGFVDHPDDPGGATNKGITFKTFKNYSRSILALKPTLENLKALTDEQAGKIYKAQYWDRIRADEFPSHSLAIFTFDFYVNAGGNAIKTLQSTLVKMGQNIVIDGAFGQNTLYAVLNVDTEALFNKYKEARIDYYENLCVNNTKLKKFLKGWKNRTNSFIYDNIEALNDVK